jgi:hypothetical protein
VELPQPREDNKKDNSLEGEYIALCVKIKRIINMYLKKQS